MKLFHKIKRGLARFIYRQKQIEPATAYDLWASIYDEQKLYLYEIFLK